LSAAVAACGWVAVAALALLLALAHRRLELVARAEHELRGPATVLGLAVERMRRDPDAAAHVAALELELERLRAGVADLSAARQGRRATPRPEPVELERLVRGAGAAWGPPLSGAGRPLRVDWQAGSVPVIADRRRVAQALGNVVANAAEHGRGAVEISGRRRPNGVLVEVRSSGPAKRRSQPGRGRGLAIAASALSTVGGRLALRSDGEVTTAALELPLDERGTA
jgi:signal transduction histidine kinase